MQFTWNEEKDRWLNKHRGISFSDIVGAMADGFLLDAVEFNEGTHIGQKAFIVVVKGYPYVVPFVIDGEKTFLKTAYPSRKMKKIYGGDD